MFESEAGRPSSHHHHHHQHLRNKTSSRPAGHFFSVWRSDDETSVNPNRLSERWRRSRSSPPRGLHWPDSEHRPGQHEEPNKWWRATSHGDLNSSDDLWSGGSPRRLPGFGFRSSHDLHAANEVRASRNDLRELRERLLARGSHNDLRSSRRNVPKPWNGSCQACSHLNSHVNSPGNQRNQNFHNFNPRPASADTEDLLFMRENEALFRY